jgi:hypothetical protein
LQNLYICISIHIPSLSLSPLPLFISTFLHLFLPFLRI